LLAVTAERDSRTAGAEKAAEAAQAAAAERSNSIRRPSSRHAQVYAEQQAARRNFLDERAARIKDARTRAAAKSAPRKRACS